MASAYLSKTFSSAGDRKTFTFSTWIKRCELGSSLQAAMFGSYTSSSARSVIRFRNDALEYQDTGSSAELITNNLSRDTNGFYHIVVAVDTTQATSSDRIKLYINGTLQTSFSSNTYPSQNSNMNTNNNVVHYVNARNVTGTPELQSEAVYAHTHFIDGTAYDASYFGETDSTTGIWKPKTAPSVTYGTNGFFLKFENSGAFGTDSSGNSNTFTVNGTMTQTIDTPSNVFCTLNPLNQTNSVSCINGNTTLSQSANDQAITGTLGFTTGKWYWEMYPRGTASNHLPEAGIVLNASAKAFSGLATASGTTQTTAIFRVFNNTGSTNNMRAMGSTTNTTVGASVTYTRDSDYINVAVDADAGKIWFGKNGTYEGGGDPAAGTNPTYDWSSNLSSVEFIVPALGHFAGADQDTEFNFGNGFFGTTQVSSAQNPDDGIGIFEYDVPTGYRALCTKSINAQEYS